MTKNQQPFITMQGTATLLIEATNIQVGKLFPIELAIMSQDQIVTISIEVLAKLLGQLKDTAKEEAKNELKQISKAYDMCLTLFIFHTQL